MRVEKAESLKRPGDAPWPVKAFAVAYALGFLAWEVILATTRSQEVRPSLLSSFFSGLLSIAIIYGILKGYRGAWFVAAFFSFLGVLGVIGLLSNVGQIRADQWSSVVLWLASTVLLFHPLTRAWVKSEPIQDHTDLSGREGGI